MRGDVVVVRGRRERLLSPPYRRSILLPRHYRLLKWLHVGSVGGFAQLGFMEQKHHRRAAA
jgi:hypothetical protein